MHILPLQVINPPKKKAYKEESESPSDSDSDFDEDEDPDKIEVPGKVLALKNPFFLL